MEYLKTARTLREKNWFFCEANPDTLHEEEYVRVYIYIYIYFLTVMFFLYFTDLL